MRSRSDLLMSCFALGCAFVLSMRAAGQNIPPTVSRIWPAGMERGHAAAFTIEGRNLEGATEVVFDTPGMSGKITTVTDVEENIVGPRAGQDLEAQVPRGKKQNAQLEITVSKDARPGIHKFRVKTALGTTNTVAFAVGTLPEVKQLERAILDSGVGVSAVELPATLVGTIAAPGHEDRYRFEGKAGEDVVFRVQASELGSKLISKLTLSDDSGKVLASAGKNGTDPDAVLSYKLSHDGSYTLSVTDRDHEGGMDYFYRVDAGPLPYITGHFPLGIHAGGTAVVSLTGVNLGGIHEVKVEPPATADGWMTMPIEFSVGGTRPLNEARVALGTEPEVMEQEPNDTIDHAQAVSPPVTINGHIDSSAQSGKNADEDYFRFHATKGEQFDIDVGAARLGSPLDSVIEILDAQGNPIPQATVRCLNQTTTTLSDRDSRAPGIRLMSTSDLHPGDYLMVGDELDQIDVIPDQPDFDTILKSMDDLRVAYLGTSPDLHAVNTPVYKTQILPPDADVPSNGLPVFHLAWRNDDGGPGYGPDSKLDFVAPADGNYILHMKDVRGMEGPEFAYRLTIRQAAADFQLKAEPANPNIPRGGSTVLTVEVAAIRDFHGPIQIQVKGLPKGVSASPATIPSGQDSTVLVLSAAADAPLDAHPAPIEIVGRAEVNGHELVRVANAQNEADYSLQLASVTPEPDVVVTTDAKKIALEPGKEVTVTLHIERQNGFKGRVPCFVQNLPPGIRVVNVGLNGVLVTEAQTSRTFVLHAEDWAQPISQPIYVVALVESNSPTMHPSDPLLLSVAPGKQSDNEHQGQAAKAQPPALAERPVDR